MKPIANVRRLIALVILSLVACVPEQHLLRNEQANPGAGGYEAAELQLLRFQEYRSLRGASPQEPRGGLRSLAFSAGALR